MKRVFSGFRRVFKSTRFNKAAVVLLIFGAGVLCGSVITSVVATSPEPNSASRSNTSTSSEERAKRTNERLEESYKRAKDRIQKDLEAKRLEQKQADEISQKLDEIYNYRKENVGQSSEDKRQELQDKRQEWRDWLEQNDISSRYFIGVI